MSVPMTVNNTWQSGGKQFAEQKTIDAETAVLIEATVPAAKAGTLTTRTNASSGEVTLGASHGVQTGDRIDLYWTEGGVVGQRLGVTVGTVAGLVVPVSGGAGDDLPTEDNAIIAGIVVTKEFSVDGDNLKAIALYSPARGAFVFEEEEGSSDADGILKRTLDASGMWGWYDGNGDDNPLEGSVVVRCHMSQAGTAATAVMRASLNHD